MYDDYDDLEDNIEDEDCFDCGEPLVRGACPCCSRGDLASCDDDYPIDGMGFADPGGRSALRAATRDNPRNLPCPTCGRPNRLTPADKRAGYQCDACADAQEFGGP